MWTNCLLTWGFGALCFAVGWAVRVLAERLATEVVVPAEDDPHGATFLPRQGPLYGLPYVGPDRPPPGRLLVWDQHSARHFAVPLEDTP